MNLKDRLMGGFIDGLISGPKDRLMNGPMIRPRASGLSFLKTPRPDLQ